MYYLLLYEVVDDYVSRRAPLREAHLRLAQEAVTRGQLILGGAFEDPVDGAALVFHADDASTVTDFVSRDPYVVAGLVTRWRIRRWNVVVGSQLANSVSSGAQQA